MKVQKQILPTSCKLYIKAEKIDSTPFFGLLHTPAHTHILRKCSVFVRLMTGTLEFSGNMEETAFPPSTKKTIGIH
jgi:hypothetical protein